MSVLYIRDGSGNFFPLPTVKGDDGVSITHSWEGTVLTITSASGTSSVDLKGSIGETGFSPTIVVTPIEGGNRLTITDVNGTQTVDLINNVDDEISATGENAVSGAAVATYVAQEIANAEVTTDSTITETGTNPVSGAAVATYVAQEIANAEVTTDSAITANGINPVTGAAVYTFVTEQILGGTW